MSASHKNRSLSAKATRMIYVLQEGEEMRHPYENALQPQGIDIVWFHTWETLMKANISTMPVAVLVDLECLKAPYELPFENLRTYFSGTDLIALSQTDTSQLALQCLRSGFSDFLLKPASPEELAYTVRKSSQKHDLVQKMKDPTSSLMRAVAQLSGCTTPTLVRIHALEFLIGLFRAEAGAWARLDTRGPEHSRILCSIPRADDSAKLLFDIPLEQWQKPKNHPFTFQLDKRDAVRLLIPMKGFKDEGLYLWGLAKKPTAAQLSTVDTLLEHAELALMNIQKFEEVKQQTFVDDLTGLYNSRYLRYALTNSIMRCKDQGQKFSVLFIDVDHFKKINDTHTHLVGSEFLITIGKTIKNAVRRIDPVFRYGGDEFVVILNDTPLDGATEIAERIRKNIERRVFVIKGQRIQTTVSIGIATYPDHAAERDDLLRMADEAMYSAKKTTRNAVRLAARPEGGIAKSN